MEQIEFKSKVVSSYEYDGKEYVLVLRKGDISILNSNDIPNTTLIVKDNDVIGKIISNSEIPTFYLSE